MAGNFNISRFKSEVSTRGGLSRGLFFECNISFPADGPTNVSFKSTDGSNDLIVCKSVTLPSETLDLVEMKYHTRAVKIPGSRQFAPFTMSFYNTNNYNLRSQFFAWMNLFNSAISNMRGNIEVDAPGADVVTGQVLSPDNFKNAFATIELTSFNNNGKMNWRDLKSLAINTGISAAESAASRINPLLGSVADEVVSRTGATRSIDSNNPKLGLYRVYRAFPTSVSGLQFSYDDDGSYQTFDVEFQYQSMTFQSLTSKPVGRVSTSEVFYNPETGEAF